MQHHCRHCGNIFCSDCSWRNTLTPSSKNPVRVCETCFEELNCWFPSPPSISPKPPPTPHPYTLFLLQRAEEGVSLSYLMCTSKDPVQRLPSAGDFWLWWGGEHLEVLMKRHQSHVVGWIGVGLVGIVCLCFCAFATPVDCQRAETVRTKHHPSL